MLCRTWIRGAIFVPIALAGFLTYSHAQTYPPLTVEVGPDHPLLLFQAPAGGLHATESIAQQTGSMWFSLPSDIRPYAALVVSVDGADPPARHVRFNAVLRELQQSEIPVVIEIASGDARSLYSLALAEELLTNYTAIKGIYVRGFTFNQYETFGGGDAFAVPPEARWTIDAIELAARQGRFIAIELDAPAWPRVMAHTQCRSLLEKIRTCGKYVLPLSGHGADGLIVQQGALMGLWMEGAVDNWGVAPASDWYSRNGLIEPGRMGFSSDGPGMPPSMYRAMMLNGVLCGATAFAFPLSTDLWTGGNTHYWDSAILPTIREILDQGLIARKEVVAKKAQVIYQLAPARTPLDFHLALRDLDAVRDQGLMLYGAYGVERAGQVPELIPNTGRHYWVPVVSPYAPPDFLGQLGRVVQPGVVSTPRAWTELLDQYHVPDGGGTAFISQVGRAFFVFHTKEHVFEEQNFQLPSVPKPIRGFEAKREGDTVTVAWPFREGDFRFKVLRRAYPEGSFEEVASNVQERTWSEPAGDVSLPVAYTVTALTSEKEAYEGTVNFGDYRVISLVESRIVEEAVLSPIVAQSPSQAVEEPQDERSKTQTWWPNTDHLTDSQKTVASEIAARIEAWDQAFVDENLDVVMDLYTTEYQDPQWWKFQYAKRAYQWFFERYGFCKMARQIQAWDFEAYEGTGIVRVQMYCRFSGTAVSDSTGRVADVTAYFPRTDTGEVWITFTKREGVWRIDRTEPAVPNFKDILSFSIGPYDSVAAGEDVYTK